MPQSEHRKHIRKQFELLRCQQLTDFSIHKQITNCIIVPWNTKHYVTTTNLAHESVTDYLDVQ